MRPLLAVALALLLAGCAAQAPEPEPRPGAAAVGYVHEDFPNPGRALPLPWLPLRVDAQGEVEGIPARLEAYRYCGREHRATPGLSLTWAGDERLRYFATESQVEHHGFWFADRLGEVLRAGDLAAGQGAQVAWRSEGAEGNDVLVFWVLRLNRTAAVAPELEEAAVRAGMPQGLVAYAASLPRTPGCCLVVWESGHAIAQHAEGLLFETCFLEGFDPLRMVPMQVPPRPPRNPPAP